MASISIPMEWRAAADDVRALCLPYSTRGGPSERRPEDPQQPFKQPMAAISMPLAFTKTLYQPEGSGISFPSPTGGLLAVGPSFTGRPRISLRCARHTRM